MKKSIILWDLNGRIMHSYVSDDFQINDNGLVYIKTSDVRTEIFNLSTIGRISIENIED